MPINTNATRSFLAETFGEIEGQISVWDKKSKQTTYHSMNELEAMLHDIAVRSKISDVYTAIGTQASALAKGQRGSVEGVVALPGFFADIDFASFGKADKAYCSGEEEALAILDKFGLKATTLLRTGRGLHGHWSLQWPHLITDAASRRDAQALWKGFMRALQAHFKSHGRDIDSVGDLTRNFRPAGTLNHNTDPPSTVEVIEREGGGRYTLDQIRTLNRQLAL